MADYFLVHDAAAFEGRTRPALAAAWRLRRFDAAQSLCVDLLPAARDFAQRYRLGADEPLLARVAAGGVPFGREFWRALVGEVLLFTAEEIPEFQVNAPTLTCLLAPEHYRDSIDERASFAPIQQALRGARDLAFGLAVYRPDHAGCNTAADVLRLADYLGAVRPESWTVADLAGLCDTAAEDHAEELAFAQEWFPSLVGLYERAAERRRLIVYESIW